MLAPDEEQAAPHPTTPRRFPNLFFILLSVSVIGLSVGIFLPLTSIIFNKMTFLDVGFKPGDTHAGLVVGLASFATIIFPFVIPSIMKRIEMKVIFVACFILTGFVLIFHIIGYYLFLWYILRFIFGICFAIILVSSETYVTVMAPAASRSKILSYYGAALALGIAIGVGTSPMWFNLHPNLPFIIAAVLSWIAAGLFFKFIKSVPFIQEKKKTEWSFLKIMPIPLAAAFIYGFLETVFTSMFPGFIMDISAKLSDSITARLLEQIGMGLASDVNFTMIVLPFFVIGGILIQIPVGWLAAHYNKTYIMMALATIAILCAITLVIVKGLGLICSLGFVLGGMITSFYVVGLSMIGDGCKPEQLPSANSFFVLIYGIGCTAGPTLNGPMMDVNSDFMLYATIGILTLFILLTTIIVWNRKKRQETADPST
jgi:MFS family permease